MHIVMNGRVFVGGLIVKMCRCRLQRRAEFGNELNSSFDGWLALKHDQEMFDMVDEFVEKFLVLHLPPKNAKNP